MKSLLEFYHHNVSLNKALENKKPETFTAFLSFVKKIDVAKHYVAYMTMRIFALGR